jgi:hypothetical protein
VKRCVSFLSVCLLLTASGGSTGADSRVGGMPDGLRGMPAQARTSGSAIQDLVAQQRALIDKARLAKTPQEREDVFRAVARNVQAIAQKRVEVMEIYTERARARVEWAKRHASEVRVADLVRAMEELSAQGPPRSPFAEKAETPQRAGKPGRQSTLSDEVLAARTRLEQTVSRLELLGRECMQARSDQRRDKIKQEIQEHLRTIEEERVAILEAVLKVSEQRLRYARQRAKEAGNP